LRNYHKQEEEKHDRRVKQIRFGVMLDRLNIPLKGNKRRFPVILSVIPQKGSISFTCFTGEL
jgi:hypothetical protein